MIISPYLASYTHLNLLTTPIDPQTMQSHCTLAISHLDKRNTYVRILFINYSSSFNTIVPSKLIITLGALGLNRALCSWVLDFLTGHTPAGEGRKQYLHFADSQHGAPQGCMLSPLLYSLLTHDCVATHASNSIIKFADDTTVVGLITNIDETAYKEVVRALGEWYQENNLSLNINKTKELIMDFRKEQREHAPLSTSTGPLQVPRRIHH